MSLTRYGLLVRLVGPGWRRFWYCARRRRTTPARWRVLFWPGPRMKSTVRPARRGP